MSLLVADYGSSSEGEEDDPMPQPKLAKSITTEKNDSVAIIKSNETVNSTGHLVSSSGEISDEDVPPSGDISDEEESGPSLGSALWDEDDLIGGASASLKLPPPKTNSNIQEDDVTATSGNDDSVHLNLSSLPKPKPDSSIVPQNAVSSGGTDELEEFVQPRDWEKEEALKARKTKFGADVAAASDRVGAVPTNKTTDKGRVKISIPRLTSADDDEDDGKPRDAGLPQSKSAKPTGSGLFAVLPKPKNVSATKMEKRPLIPHVLTKKPTPSATKSAASGSKRPPPPSDDDKTNESNFFSLDDQVSTVSSDVSKRIRVAPSPNVTDFAKLKGRVSHPDPEDAPLAFSSDKKSFLSAPPTVGSSSTSVPVSSASSQSPAPSAAQMYNMAGSSATYDPQEVDETRSNLASLMGAQRVRGGDLDQLNIVDVNADSALGGTSSIQENLLRELSAASESGYRPRPKKGEEPSGLSKRKHQITYLAFQAKEREQMLKNQWAQNAQTKRQTQAKYGF